MANHAERYVTFQRASHDKKYLTYSVTAVPREVKRLVFQTSNVDPLQPIVISFSIHATLGQACDCDCLRFIGLWLWLISRVSHSATDESRDLTVFAP